MQVTGFSLQENRESAVDAGTGRKLSIAPEANEFHFRVCMALLRRNRGKVVAWNARDRHTLDRLARSQAIDVGSVASTYCRSSSELQLSSQTREITSSAHSRGHCGVTKSKVYARLEI